MKCLDDHHHYLLEYFETEVIDTKQYGPVVQRQELKFIKKEPISEGSTELITVHNGTTNEEVLKMLIHRLSALNAKFPCRENSIAITHIETALLWLEKRTADRVARGVEGKQIK